MGFVVVDNFCRELHEIHSERQRKKLGPGVRIYFTHIAYLNYFNTGKYGLPTMLLGNTY